MLIELLDFNLKSCDLLFLTNIGEVQWEPETPGTDGVIVNKILDEKIWGSGQYDPIEGWKECTLTANWPYICRFSGQRVIRRI